MRPALPIWLSYQPLVTIGGGAFGDLPAHAAKTQHGKSRHNHNGYFLHGIPQGSIHQIALWGIALRRLVQKNHTNAGFSARGSSDSLLFSDR